MAKDWYLKQDGKIYGPISSKKLRGLASESRVSESAEVSNNQKGPWHNAFKVKGLFPVHEGHAAESNLDHEPPPPEPVEGTVPHSHLAVTVAAANPPQDSGNIENEHTIWTGRPSQITNLKTFIGCGFAFILLAVIWVICLFGFKEDDGSYIAWALFLAMMIPIWTAFWAWLNLRFMTYEVTNQRFRISHGVLTRSTDELELYRVKDTAFSQDLFQRVTGLATIRMMTSDVSNPRASIDSIPAKQAEQLREDIRLHVERLRTVKRVREVDYN